MNAVKTPMIFISAELTTNTKLENDVATATLKRYLKDNGKTFGTYQGRYKGANEVSFGVFATEKDTEFFLDAAKVFGQDSVLKLDASREGELIFSSGQVEPIGKMQSITEAEALKQDNFTKCITTGNYFNFRG